MNNSARKDEIAQHFACHHLGASWPGTHEVSELAQLIKSAITRYEEERTPPSSDESGSVRCPNGHGFVYRSPLDATLQCMRCERDHYAEQLGLVYDHVTNGKLSKPYDLRGVKSTIDDCITEQVNEAVKEELEERPRHAGKERRMSEQGIAERLRAMATTQRDIDGESCPIDAECSQCDCTRLLDEAADELDRLQGELDKWIAFRQGDTAVIQRLQAFLETQKSAAPTREVAIYDRIRTRERRAFDAGATVGSRIPSGPPTARQRAIDIAYAVYLTEHAGKDH